MLETSVKIGPSIVIADGQNHTIPLLISLKEKTLDEEKVQRTPLDLVFVIDRSGSMSGNKINQVKQTLLKLLELLDPLDRLSIVLFDNHIQVVSNLRRATKENCENILKPIINGINARGSTNIVGGLIEGIKILKNRKTKNSVASIFLLSDGEDSYHLRGLDQTLNDPEIPNLTINSFGYGDDHDETSLTKISEAKKGSFYFIKDVSLVDQAFVDCFALLTSVIGKATAKIILHPSPLFKEIAFKTCFGPNWKGDADLDRVLEVGYLVLGMDRSFVAEIQLNGDQTKMQDDITTKVIAVVEFTLEGVTSPPQTFSISKELEVKVQKQVGDTKIEVTQDLEVEQEYLRVQGAKALQDTKNLISEGKNDMAQKVIDDYDKKIKTTSIDNAITKNLSAQVKLASNYLEQSKKAPMNMMATKAAVQMMSQQYSANMNQQSAPEWNQGMYQNSRQKRMVDNIQKK